MFHLPLRTLLFARGSLWIALNVAGVCIYLYLSSKLWGQPGEEGMPGGAGDPFYWFFFLVPILVVYLAVNAIALYVIVRRIVRGDSKTTLFAWSAMAALWICTVAYDHHRAHRLINPEYSLAPHEQKTV